MLSLCSKNVRVFTEKGPKAPHMATVCLPGKGHGNTFLSFLCLRATDHQALCVSQLPISVTNT